MASQVSPGIILKERDLSNVVIVGAQQITAAIAGAFVKGPINQITNISSQRELVNIFGKPTDANAEDWYVASEFLSYGGRLAVVRTSTGVENASTDGGYLVQNDQDWISGGFISETFIARTAGTWGNSLLVAVVDRGADQYVTLSAAPDVIAQQTILEFTNGKTAEVVSWDAQTLVASILLTNGSGLIASGDVLEGGSVLPGAAAITATAVSDWYTNTEITYGMGQTTGIKLSAIGPRPGTSEYASTKGIEWDEVHVAVIDLNGIISGSANNIVETFTYLSKLGDGKSTEGADTYYRNVINQQSSYIFTGAHPSTQYNVGNGAAYYAWGLQSSEMESGDKFTLALVASNALYGGVDDYQYNSAEYGDAIDLFLDTEETNVDFILMGGSMTLENDTKAKANKVISIAASRKDCIAFVSPHKGNQVGSNGALTSSQQKVNTINFFNGLTSTSFAIFDSGYKYFYDRFNDKYRYLPCNGDVAGLCVSTSATLDDWYSPAGVNRGSLRNAVRLAYNPNKADRDELYQARINPIVSFPGSGVTLFGDKTALASPSAFDRINVRRLFLNIEKRVGDLSKQVLFEQNDEATRSSFSSAVNAYLNEVQARRGVTDFLVVCNESNNTPDVIDRNEFVAEIYIKPTRSINYITVTFTATKTGVSFNEVVGR
jgi:hypothetical protein